jgi:hypothetical protein
MKWRPARQIGVGVSGATRVEPLAVAYLQAAMESLVNPDERAGGLLALRSVAEA